MFITALLKMLSTNVNEGFQVESMDLITDTNLTYEF